MSYLMVAAVVLLTIVTIAVQMLMMHAESVEESTRIPGMPATVEELTVRQEQAAPEQHSPAAVKRFSLPHVPLSRDEDRIIFTRDTGHTGECKVFTPEMNEHARQWLEANATALQSLDDVAKSADARSYIDLSHHDIGASSNQGDVWSACLLLGEQAVYHGELGEPAAAASAISTLLLTANSLRNEPLIDSQMKIIAATRVALKALECVLNKTPLSYESLDVLSADFAGMECRECYVRAVAGERIRALDYVDNEGDWNGEQRDFRKLFWRATYRYSISNVDRIQIVRMCEQIANAHRLPYADSVRVGDDLYEQLRRASGWKSPNCSWILMHAAVGLRCAAQEAALVRIGCASLAIEAYRADKGDLPKQLADLVPEYLDAVPEDPFNGADLKYALSNNAYAVSSFGYDWLELSVDR